MSPVVLDLPRFPDGRGVLTVLDYGSLPFVPRRSFWIEGASEGTTRGAHAHREQFQALVCVAGALRVSCQWFEAAGVRQSLTVDLTNSGRVVIIPPWVWSDQVVLAAGSRYVVFASGPYNRAEYLDIEKDWLLEAEAAWK
jgi:dTDP-4-dehydrorhamnose 3,5-epimerase-like enzyme